jgi:glycerate kinase
MRFLIAPNAFKGTLPAEEAARLLVEEIESNSGHECLCQPVADGGDGTCSLLIDSLGLQKVYCMTLNALGLPILGYFGWDSQSRKAFIDVSTASGLGTLAEFQKDPYTTSTFGTGLLIRNAIDLGAEQVILGLGGSATVDLGTGILSALGILFLDQDGREIPLFSPGFLPKISHIQKSPNIPKIRFTCLCDVRNPFFGANGAVFVFGPQKGLKPNQVIPFERDCARVVELFKKKSKKDWVDVPGFGAAGGIALGLDSFFDTRIKFGADFFFDQVGMKNKVMQSDWILTGEGQYDAQSVQGKASFHLLELAKKFHKKIALITSGEGGRDAGFDLVLELPPLDFSLQDFKEKARENLCRLIQKAILEKKFD